MSQLVHGVCLQTQLADVVVVFVAVAVVFLTIYWIYVIRLNLCTVFVCRRGLLICWVLLELTFLLRTWRDLRSTSR